MTLFVKFTDISFNPTTQKMQCKIQNMGKTPEKIQYRKTENSLK